MKLNVHFCVTIFHLIMLLLSIAENGGAFFRMLLFGCEFSAFAREVLFVDFTWKVCPLRG